MNAHHAPPLDSKDTYQGFTGETSLLALGILRKNISTAGLLLELLLRIKLPLDLLRTRTREPDTNCILFASILHNLMYPSLLRYSYMVILYMVSDGGFTSSTVSGLRQPHV